jgi:hypothetical protein
MRAITLGTAVFIHHFGIYLQAIFVEKLAAILIVCLIEKGQRPKPLPEVAPEEGALRNSS